MASKDKLKRFKENESFRCLIQPRTEEVLGVDHPLKGCWAEKVFGNGNPIVLELGCGKGEYTLELARRCPGKNFIGVDIKGARLWRGAKTATEGAFANVAFLRTHIEFITSLFALGEVSEIWITFADPQLLRERKRLVSPMFLERYRLVMAPGGVVNLKTDSRFLHEYAYAFCRRNGLKVLVKNDDIYGGGTPDSSVAALPQNDGSHHSASADVPHRMTSADVPHRMTSADVPHRMTSEDVFRHSDAKPEGRSEESRVDVFRHSEPVEESRAFDSIVTDVQTFYEGYYLKMGKKITYLKFDPSLEPSVPYVSPNDNPAVKAFLSSLEQIEVATKPISFATSKKSS